MPKFVGLDLNWGNRFCDPAKGNFVGTTNEPRQTGVRAGDGASASDHLPAVCGPLSGRAQGQILLLSGSIPVHGICATDLSRKPARSRSLSAGSTLQALPSWNSICGGAQ